LAGPPRERPLAVVDWQGHTVFETKILVASPPQIEPFSPSVLEYHVGASPGALRIRLNTQDTEFFAAI
jgi:hypothetical protein